jgi:hypothetical protein
LWLNLWLFYWQMAICCHAMPREQQLERGIVSCGWRKEAGGVAANWFASDDPLALQWWDSNFGMRYLALDMAFVQRLVLIVVVGRCGIGLAHNQGPRMENVTHQMISLSAI